MSFDYHIESFGFNYRDNGYNQDGLGSTAWKIAHYIPLVSTFIAIFDLKSAYESNDINVRDRARIALLPAINLILIPIDLFYTIGHICNACITAD